MESRPDATGQIISLEPSDQRRFQRNHELDAIAGKGVATSVLMLTMITIQLDLILGDGVPR